MGAPRNAGQLGIDSVILKDADAGSTFHYTLNNLFFRAAGFEVNEDVFGLGGFESLEKGGHHPDPD